MKELIFEVIMGVLVLSLMTGTITLFRNNEDIIHYAAEHRYNISKIKENEWIPLKEQVCLGRDVAAAVRYYSNNPAVEVKVITEGITKIYITETFNLTDWDAVPLFYERYFEATYEFDNKNLKQIIYTMQKN